MHLDDGYKVFVKPSNNKHQGKLVMNIIGTLQMELFHCAPAANKAFFYPSYPMIEVILTKLNQLGNFWKSFEMESWDIE